MWSQMEDSGDCCGFILKRTANRTDELQGMEAFHSTKTGCKKKETDLSAHIPVYIHLYGAQAEERSFSTERKRGMERRREERKKEKEETFEA